MALAPMTEHPVHYDNLSHLGQLRAVYSQAASPTPAKKSVAPAPPSQWVSEAEIATQRVRVQQAQPIALTAPATISSSTRPTPARQTPARLARLKALMQTFIRQFIAFLFPKQADRRTARGQAALTQLQALANLLHAEFDGSGMDLVAYQVAFGEAYYNVLTASREHYKRHKGKEAEDYQPYFENFLRQMP